MDIMDKPSNPDLVIAAYCGSPLMQPTNLPTLSVENLQERAW